MAKKKVVKKSKSSKKKVAKRPVLKSKKRTAKSPIQKKKMPSKRWHAVPLKGSFMVIAILGFLISAYWIYPQSFNFGVAFMVVFAAMFVAALISMTKAPIVPKNS